MGDEDDRFGLDSTTPSAGSLLGWLTTRLVPQALAKRAIAVSVETDRERYAPGDPVTFAVELHNRLPVAVAIRTSSPRVWGWTVDGELEASDEARYPGETSRVIRFGGHETKRLTHEWSGLYKRTGDPTEWVEPEPGDHELVAYLDVGEPRPTGRTTVRFDRRDS